MFSSLSNLYIESSVFVSRLSLDSSPNIIAKERLSYLECSTVVMSPRKLTRPVVHLVFETLTFFRIFSQFLLLSSDFFPQLRVAFLYFSGLLNPEVNYDTGKRSPAFCSTFRKVFIRHFSYINIIYQLGV